MKVMSMEKRRQRRWIEEEEYGTGLFVESGRAGRSKAMSRYDGSQPVEVQENPPEWRCLPHPLIAVGEGRRDVGKVLVACCLLPECSVMHGVVPARMIEDVVIWLCHLKMILLVVEEHVEGQDVASEWNQYMTGLPDSMGAFPSFRILDFHSNKKKLTGFTGGGCEAWI